MVCGRTQSPNRRYVLGGVSGVGCENGGGREVRRGCSGLARTGPAAPRTDRAEGFKSRGGRRRGSMRDCGGNRKDEVGIGVESLTSAVYASALRALCVLARGVSALRAGLGPTGTLAGASPTPQILLNPLLAVRVV